MAQAIVIREKRASIEEMPPSDCAVDKPVGHFLKRVFDGEDLAHCGWCHPWDGGPGFCKKAG